MLGAAREALRRSRVLLAVGGLSVVIGLAACGRAERRAALSQVVVGVEKDHGVIVVTGLGRRIERKRAEWSPRGRLQVGYFSPAVHPGRERFVAVRCMDLPVSRSGDWSGWPQGCQLVEWRLGTDRERVLYETREGMAMDSARWDPGGSRIALISGSKIMVLDGASARVLSSTEVPEAGSARPWDYYWLREYLCWDTDGRRLYLAGTRGGGADLTPCSAQ